MDKRIRSPNYPALSLADAIERVGVLYKSLHTHSAPREIIAKGLGYNSLNGASASAISALHKYGLLERSGDEVRIGERAMRIMHPHTPEERVEAIREAASAPQLFAELAERFPGERPSEELLRNYLVRKGFAQSAVSSVVLAYRDTLDLVERESSGYGVRVMSPTTSEDPRLMQAQGSYPIHATMRQNIPTIQGHERTIGNYEFEDGSYIRIVAGGSVQTEAALTMADTLIQLKRAEIKARASVPAVANSPRTEIDNESDPNA